MLSIYKQGRQISWVIDQKLDHGVVIAEICDFLESQNIAHRYYEYVENYKCPIARVVVCRRSDVLYLTKRLLPYLIVKRAKALKVISMIESKPVHPRTNHRYLKVSE